MGCQGSKQATQPDGKAGSPAPFLAVHGASCEGDLETAAPTLLDDHNPTSKRVKFMETLKSGAKSGAGLGTGLASSGSTLVQRSGASLLQGGSHLLSAADPRRLVSRHSDGEYLPVEDTGSRHGEATSPVATSAEEQSGKCRICAWLWACLVWVACMSSGLFLFHTGLMPAVFGTRVSYCILAMIASPVLLPVAKALVPIVNHVANSLKGTKCYMWTVVIAMWCSLAWVIMVLWDLGIMQVVIGVISAQAIMVIIAILLVVPCLVYALPKLKEMLFAIPGKVKAKLWEIPPAILPLVESMMVGLLSQMEERILHKLATMPRDVAHAVTHVGSAATDLGKKGFGKAREVGSRSRSGLRRMSTKSSSNTTDSCSSEAGYESA